MSSSDNIKTLAVSVGASFIVYHFGRFIYNRLKTKKKDFVPIGVIKELYIYPVKSWKGKSIFSLFCGPHGSIVGDMRDRHFQVVNGDTGLFYTARQKPKMVLIEADVKGSILTVKFPDGKTCQVDLEVVKSNEKIIRTTLFDHLKQDGMDCGDEIGQLLSEFIDEPNTRLVAHFDNLYTERTITTKQEWWNNNEVPFVKYDAAFTDFAPFLVETQASLDDLNTRLEEKVTLRNFRPNIIIDKCAAYDEDKWEELKIGDVHLQCFCPSTRCIFTTINPDTGVRNSTNEPLKTLRSYRLAPEGNMRKEFKNDPMFGVNVAMKKPGYIHVGQVVYARYKDCAF